MRQRAIADWRNRNPPDAGTRLTAYSAKGAGRLNDLTPSKKLDMHLSSREFANNVAVCLGVDVMEAGGSCSICGAVLDSFGIHCQSCMAGGDAERVRNALRDVVADYCRRGALRPETEASGLLPTDGRERPVAVMVIPSLTLA